MSLKVTKYLAVPILAMALCGCAVNAAQPSKAGSAELEWAFTQADQKPEALLIRVIDGAQTTLDVAIYSLTKPDIVDAIKKAKQRGVAVRIVTDKIQSSGKTQEEALKLLGSAGIPIKINKHSGLMHLKMVVADNSVATTGSFNYSKAASTTNDEVLMAIHDADVAKSFADEFERMWQDDKRFEAITPRIAQPDVSKADSSSGGSVTYKTCAEVKAAGKAPLRKGDPGYSAKLDRDGDGVACDQ